MTDDIRVGTLDGLTVADAVCVDDAEILFGESNPETDRTLGEFDR